MSYESLNLREKRKEGRTPKHPFQHQIEAFEAMDKLFSVSSSIPDLGKGGKSGLLVLPTGGGKTFTAVDWICKNILAKDIKVLWLAHTFHLLDQAYQEFLKLSYRIPEPRDILNIRVISSHSTHSKSAQISPSDDVVIMTTQTAISNYETEDLNPKGEKIQSRFYKFLEENRKKRFFIVVDEAHHAPAYGCRNLLMSMKKLLPEHQLLGLTATPSYTDKRRRGWLTKIFEDEIIYQAKKEILRKGNILATPVYIKLNTDIPVELDDKQYKRLMREHKDLPEDIIENLAKNNKRNDYIVHSYLKGREKYGKTIIFADRWFQCEYIKQKLEAKGVKVDAVYSRIESSLRTFREQNAVDSDHNKKTIDKFKKNEIDVLINVKMLTEGTDVPDVKSVFLTRDTKSKILLTQMMGRALRGKKAGGGPTKDTAYIVHFIDEWRQLVHWARHDLSGGLDESTGSSSASPSHIEYISLSLIRELSRQMESKSGFPERPYLEIVPIGWYETEYTVVVDDETEETVTEKNCVLVYSPNETKFKNFIKNFSKAQKENALPDWRKENLSAEWLEERSSEFVQKYFDEEKDNFGGTLKDDLIDLARHISQNDNSAPKFRSFADRHKYDLDKIALGYIDKPISPIERERQLRSLFEDDKLDWKVLYKNYDNFKKAYNFSSDRAVAMYNGELPREKTSQAQNPSQQENKAPEPRELTDYIKQLVKKRDGNKCLCCHADRKLQVDHIEPYKYTASTTWDNSQTLCRYCNQQKGSHHIDFRRTKSQLLERPEFRLIEPGEDDWSYYKKDFLEICLRRTINFFYFSEAVYSIKFRSGECLICLYPGNDPKWLKKNSKKLLAYIKKDLKSSRAEKLDISRYDPEFDREFSFESMMMSPAIF